MLLRKKHNTNSKVISRNLKKSIFVLFLSVQLKFYIGYTGALNYKVFVQMPELKVQSDSNTKPV